MSHYHMIMRTALIAVSALGAAVSSSALAQNDGRISSECRTVLANREWQGSRIIVRPQEFVCVAADGIWSHGVQMEQAFIPYYGPEGYGRDDPSVVPGPILKLGSLVGKIGTNTTFIVGRQMCFVPRATGELMLSMNDDAGNFANNFGRLGVHVVKWPLSAIPLNPALNPRGCRR